MCTTFCVTCFVKALFIICVRNHCCCCLSNKNLSTSVTVLTFCKTCGVASCRNCCIYYLNVSKCVNCFLSGYVVASCTMLTFCKTCICAVRCYCSVNYDVVSKHIAVRLAAFYANCLFCTGCFSTFVFASRKVGCENRYYLVLNTHNGVLN